MAELRSLPLLLSALLLLAQLLLAAHHADLDTHAQDSQCDVCLVGHGLNHASTPGGLALSPASPESFFCSTAVPVAAAAPVFAYHSRAPPAFPA